MVHLRILYATLGESCLLKLPLEMLTTIFQHVTEGDVVFWILKVVEDGPPQRHEY